MNKAQCFYNEHEWQMMLSRAISIHPKGRSDRHRQKNKDKLHGQYRGLQEKPEHVKRDKSKEKRSNR